MKLTKFILLACAAFASVSGVALADDVALAPRQVPAKTVPVPGDVSPELQKLIAAPYNPNWNAQWTTGEAWRKAANIQAAAVMKNIPAMQARLGVTVQPTTIGGVRAYIVTPNDIPPEHRDKVLIHIHGGCYELYPGESGTTEAMIMAGLGHYRVISVDYRMPPEAYFPAALDDVETVYKSVLSTHDSKNVGVFGTSAGGALVLELMLRAKHDGLPMPGAIAPGTPMSDLTKVGDSFYTNEKVDNVLVSRNGFCQAAANVFAHGHDLKDPLLSPVYGDMHGFPPAILTTGTRDLLLSNTVRVHQKLQQSGVEAQLEVFDGMSHAQYQMDDRVPEARAAFAEITQFFDKHLGH
ncbi:alpha/beta hydrolase [Paraburkholderia flagellata]|uniref:alpha/beta hydrolase n=1 Tax=Paraburkholderia flagellata TaxID=2883241 RepID=UPI001F1833EA|nr:alpha/beta hydrolase [Paraburkholderia flagellata]